ncbi:emerin L homeolog isoform X1 [Xenopus laevis]|uniref:Emerin L homeolog isoform X1 n=1 Tax=Xenopus laevis TaxID=8355 RepID=A0A8J1LHB7_XENLA|nr:emerin L homeolog isoform X1 [Xenopus laevis]
MENYKRMSDDELIETLQKCNITHGPIVGTTRTLYEKKLYEYERSKTRNQYPLGSYESKTHYRNRANEEDLEDEDFYVEKTVTRTYQYPQARSRVTFDQLEREPLYKENTYQPISQMRQMGTTQRVEPRRPIHVKQNEENPSKRYFPVWLQILFLFLFVGFLAALYFLQEPDDNPFMLESN